VTHPEYPAPLYRQARAGWATRVAAGGVVCHLAGLAIAGASISTTFEARPTSTLHINHAIVLKVPAGQGASDSPSVRAGSLDSRFLFPIHVGLHRSPVCAPKVPHFKGCNWKGPERDRIAGRFDPGNG
jgi:hypothetical protein